MNGTNVFTLLGKIAIDGVEKAKSDLSGVSSEAKKTSSESKNLSNSFAGLTEKIGTNAAKLAQLRIDYADVVLQQGRNSDAAKDLENQMKELNDELATDSKRLGDAVKTSDELADSLNDAEKATNPLVDGLKKIGKAVITYLAVDKIISFGKEVVNVAAEVSAETSAFNQIMGDYSEEAANKMSKIADATGMVDSRLTPYMTSMTAKFKGLGYDVEEATDYASRGLNLAADAAAFWDKSLDDSMSHLNSFVNGSYEGGEAIGLFANDTQMAAYAINKGLVETTAEWSKLDEATKQATRLEYAENMMKASGATGQAAKESEQYANVQANLTESWRQFKAQIGEPLLQHVVLPAMKALQKFISETLMPAWDKLTEKVKEIKAKLEEAKEWFDKNKESIQQVATVIGILATALGIALIAFNWTTISMGLMTAATTAWTSITTLATTVTTAFGTAMAFLTSPVTLVILAIGALIAIIYLLVKNWDTVKEKALEVWERIKEIWQGVKDWFNETVVEPLKQLFSNIDTYFSDKFGAAWDGIKSIVGLWIGYFKNIWESIKLIFSVVKDVFTGNWSGAWEGIKKIVGVWVDYFKNIWNNIKNVFSSVKSWFSDKFGQAWQAIKDKFASWGQFWGGLWDKVKQKFTNLGTSIGNAISGAVKSGINGVISMIESTINRGISLINGGINLINKIPGVNIGRISRLSLPRLAKGAVLDEETAFIGGEYSGARTNPELVTPQNLMADTFRETLDNYNSKGNFSNEDTRAILELLKSYLPMIARLQVYLDKNELVGALVDPMDEALGNLAVKKGRGY